jgi:hypothetical protein
MSSMQKCSHKSNGQGNLFSRLYHKVSADGASIVTRQTRCLSGQSPRIQVHQHYGFKLHLVWRAASNSTERSIERYFFKYEGVQKFCTQLINGALDGICTCVCREVLRFLEEKREPCFREPPLQTYGSTSWINCCQQYFSDTKCCCPVISSTWIRFWN